MPVILLGQNYSGKNELNNLVRNHSFEQYQNCEAPNFSNNGPLYWNGKFGPDYFNLCSATFNPMDNIRGTQAPLSGQAYVSLAAAHGGFSDGSDEFYEYVYQQLPNSLVRGLPYYIEFHASLAEVSRFAVNKLGLYVTDDFQDIENLPFNLPAGFTPQIPMTFPTQPYLDMSNWVKISGYYIPQVPGDQYIILGNFTRIRDYSRNPSAGYNGVTSGQPFYYFDDVFVGEYSCCPDLKLFQNTTSLPAFTAVNDLILAGNDVNAPGSTGDVKVLSNQFVSFKSGREIILKPGFSVDSGGAFLASIGTCERGIDDNQLFVDINVNEGATDRQLTAVVLNGSGTYNYLWDTGETTPAITVPIGATRYTVTVTDNNIDASYDAPCNTKVGWSEYQGICTICRKGDKDITNEISQNHLEEKIGGEIQLFPNPASDFITVKGDNINGFVEISDMLGNRVLGDRVGKSNISIDVSALKPGLYLIKVWSNERVFSRKFIIE